MLRHAIKKEDNAVYAKPKNYYISMIWRLLNFAEIVNRYFIEDALNNNAHYAINDIISIKLSDLFKFILILVLIYWIANNLS